ncbi:hypothetical protein EJ994_13095 [Maribacter sp. MJ134]|uniref:hypothetical protein n=1 Tax=Maribacter sp. MJ134 TaxID=2496865 RepID=UPI000F81C6DA|nr:hypothetical protein [Maribacter sp. MJ134]AZQ59694.1 hypothetical protein EJ994_13095 [Maribacter sp. MJ134]
MTFKMLEDDRIKFYYIPEHKNTYDEDNVIETKITGSSKIQGINIELNQIPKKFRIDLGESKHETTISIASIIIGTMNDRIEINEKTIHRFFSPNIYAIKSENGYKRISIDNRYDPFIESTALLHQKIKLEFF